MTKRIAWGLIAMVLVGVFVATKLIKHPTGSPPSSNNSVANSTTVVRIDQTNNTDTISPPISNALNRITKKPFGVYVSPGHSPASPERFTGYHTGADFETTPAEQNADVPISAICAGKVLLSKYVSGYGGVLVQACDINNKQVTVVYGHLRLSSINVKIGDSVRPGQQFAELGTGYSPETDNERKHLHLGIHDGTAINILGYVQNKADLANWLDPQKLLNG